jgi:DNA-binding CsgD family transcriptional regulator
LACDVAAFLSVQLNAASIRLKTWPDRALPAEDRPPIRGSVVTSKAPALPLRSAAAVRWPGGLDIVFAGHSAVHCQLLVPLLTRIDHQSAWLIGRAGRAFSTEEIELVTLLTPVLTMRANRVNAQSPTAPDQALTSREAEVLAMVACGLTDRAIAHRLTLSPRTVEKHLEHVYRKLDCADRLSAVLRIRERNVIGR